MLTYSGESLRGYARPILKRDGFKCRYCGWDGSQWPNWLFMSEDHLLPVGHPKRDEEQFRVACCRFCNEAHNLTRFEVEGKSPDQLVEQKKPFVLARRDEFKRFWEKEVNLGR